MNLAVSQSSQLLQNALEHEQQSSEVLESPNQLEDGNDSSLDSRVIPAGPATPRYHLQASLLHSPENSENPHKEAARPSGTSPTLSDNAWRGTSSDPFRQHGDRLSLHTGMVIGTRTVSFQSPPTAAPPMPVESRYYRRSPSFPSQDSFGGPVSQDPAEKYLASAKQFDVPLSDLGETPTQEVIHSPTDPGMTLPDASEHKEFLDVAMREYEAQRANRPVSHNHPNILVAATPSDSSGASQLRDDFPHYNHGSGFAGQQSRFEFNGPSSYDKMLDRGLTDGPDPTPEPTTEIQPTQVKDLIDIDALSKDNSNQHSPPFEWVVPAPSSDVTSSNPRSLLRMVHPGNQYRIARMRKLAGDVEPPACVSVGAETQPCHVDSSSALPTARGAANQTKVTDHRPGRDQPRKRPEDTLDVVPDSEPLQAGSSSHSSTPQRGLTRSPLKKVFRPLSPVSEHGSGDLVPDSQEAEETEEDIPLAVEVASSNRRKAAAPARDVAVPAKKTKAASSILARPAQEKRMSSTKMKPESTEVPTSLPEQDLQGRASPHIQLPTTNAGSSKELKRSRNNAMYLLTNQPVAVKKRYHKSDTESSEDSLHQSAEDKKAVYPKEEEESADDSPPPPPPKPETHKKRRRIEDVNPARGMPKAPVSTRVKSETPAVATRSVKRLRSGASSSRGQTAELPTRVFALWKQDGHYYSGVVHSRKNQSKFSVKFDDLTQDDVELRNIRSRELRVGDRVIVIQGNIKGAVSDVSQANSHGQFVLEFDDGESVKNVQVKFDGIRIANRTIQSQWNDRMLSEENIVTLVKPKPLTDTTPSKQSVASIISGIPQRDLVKTGFVVTINPKNEEPAQMKEVAMNAIRLHGGTMIEDWSNVFTMEGKHSKANKRWTASPKDFCWKSEVNLDRVFLLSDDAHQKPKFLLALALGIPCLSFEWLTKEGKLSADWQPYLLPAGYSDILGARISQLVDLDWGNCTEHLTDIMANRVPAKLFAQKKVLCVGADLVPLPPTRVRKKIAQEESSRYVPWIILCMGAAMVEAITDFKQVSLDEMKSFDYVIVKDRGILESLELGERDKVVLGDVNWVKDCLVSARLSLPE